MGQRKVNMLSLMAVDSKLVKQLEFLQKGSCFNHLNLNCHCSKNIFSYENSIEVYQRSVLKTELCLVYLYHVMIL